MTVEPRMEELLASIRKAIHDDIGEVPASTSARSSGTLQRGAVRELHVRAGDDAGSAAAEIQQLREKISRTRGSDTLLREPLTTRVQPNVSPQASDMPRRSWRDLEPAPALRPTMIETDYDAPRRQDYRRAPVEDAYEAPAPVMERGWHEEPQAALPPPSRDRAMPRDPSMLSGDAAEAVQSAFNRLAENMFARATGERSVEDLTRELLRGMLKQWLDENLPSLVERLVREEIERVARRGR